MNQPEPDWYAELKGEPLRSRMFTPELAARIRTKAVRKTEAKIQPSLRRVLNFGVMAGCMAVILLLAVQLNRLSPPDPAIGSTSMNSGINASAAGGGHGTPTGSPTAPAETGGGVKAAEETEDDRSIDTGESVEAVEADPTDGKIRYARDSDIPTLMVAEPTLEEWQMLIDASYPELRTEILHEESVGDGRRLILSRKLTAVGEAVHGVVAADEFVREGDGWQRKTRLTYTPPDNLKNSGAGMLTGNLGIIGPGKKIIGIFMGFVLDPAITRVRVKDHLDGAYEAKLFPDAEGVTVWFARTPEQEHRRYMIEGLDEDGNVADWATLNWHSMKHREGEGRVDEAVKF